MSEVTKEIDAIKKIHGELEPFDKDAQERILNYIANLLNLSPPIVDGRKTSDEHNTDGNATVEDVEEPTKQSQDFATFAELFDAVKPRSNGEKALVAGYWLQECQKKRALQGLPPTKNSTIWVTRLKTSQVLWTE